MLRRRLLRGLVVLVCGAMSHGAVADGGLVSVSATVLSKSNCPACHKGAERGIYEDADESWERD